jgi:hypothetical protein
MLCIIHTTRPPLQVLLSHKMNTLLLLLPLAIVSHASQWPAGVTFSLALLPLCSLAEVRAAGGGGGGA